MSVTGHRKVALILLPAFLVFVVLLFRIVTVPNHFSVWAAGDAQMYIAGKHFADEGFLVHHLLPLTTPGIPHSFIPNNGPTGHYSHYPALHALIDGVLIRVAHRAGIADDLKIKAGMQIFYTLVVASGLGFWFLAIRRLFGPIVAALFVLLLALSPWVTGFADSFCDQPLNIVLLGLFVYFAVRWFDSPKGWGAILVPSLAILSFLVSQNTVEMLPVLATFSIIYGITVARATRSSVWQPVVTVLVSVLAFEIASIIFHFYLSYLDFGSWDAFVSHWHLILIGRYPVTAEGWLQSVDAYLKVTQQYPNLAAVVLLFAAFAYLLWKLTASEIAAERLQGMKQCGFLLAFAAGMLSSALVSPQQASAMYAYSGLYIYVPAILLSVVAILYPRLNPALIRVATVKFTRALTIVGAAGLLSIATTTTLNGVTLLVSPLSVTNPGDPFWGHFANDVLSALVKPEVRKAIESATIPSDIFLFRFAVEPARFEISPIWEFYLQRHGLPFFGEADLKEICAVLEQDRLGLAGRSPVYRYPRLFIVGSLTPATTGEDFVRQLQQFRCKP